MFNIIIPARLKSTRLPNKVLLDIGGSPMIAHTIANAKKTHAKRIIIATDTIEVSDACKNLGVEVVMTSASHNSGVERLGEAIDILGFADTDIVVNLQADEPMLPASLINKIADNLIKAQQNSKKTQIATLSEDITTESDLLNPNIVKVVTDTSNFALYFSRNPIPWGRDIFLKDPLRLKAPIKEITKYVYQRHIGLYAYSCDFIREYLTWNPCNLENLEKLEQLRILFHNKKILVIHTKENTGLGIDTEADLTEVRKIFAKKS